MQFVPSFKYLPAMHVSAAQADWMRSAAKTMAGPRKRIVGIKSGGGEGALTKFLTETKQSSQVGRVGNSESEQREWG